MQTDTLPATYAAAAQTDRGRDRVARIADALADVATLHRDLALDSPRRDHADARFLARLADSFADAARDATTPDATGPGAPPPKGHTMITADTLAPLAEHVHGTADRREASSVARAVARSLADALADLAVRDTADLADLAAHHTPSLATVSDARAVCEAWRAARARRLPEAVATAPTVARIADALATIYQRDTDATHHAVRSIRAHRYADTAGTVGTGDAAADLANVARRLAATADDHRALATEAGAL